MWLLERHPVISDHGDWPAFLDPLRDAAELACWYPLDQPCHASVLIEFLAVGS